jgi:hypothetical protein
MNFNSSNFIITQLQKGLILKAVLKLMIDTEFINKQISPSQVCALLTLGNEERT